MPFPIPMRLIQFAHAVVEQMANLIAPLRNTGAADRISRLDGHEGDSKISLLTLDAQVLMERQNDVECLPLTDLPTVDLQPFTLNGTDGATETSVKFSHGSLVAHFECDLQVVLRAWSPFRWLAALDRDTAFSVKKSSKIGQFCVVEFSHA